MKVEKTVHKCSHAFKSVLDSNGANRKCIDMLMEHASEYLEDRLYSHKTLDELEQR